MRSLYFCKAQVKISDDMNIVALHCRAKQQIAWENHSTSNSTFQQTVWTKKNIMGSKKNIFNWFIHQLWLNSIQLSMEFKVFKNVFEIFNCFAYLGCRSSDQSFRLKNNPKSVGQHLCGHFCKLTVHQLMFFGILIRYLSYSSKFSRSSFTITKNPLSHTSINLPFHLFSSTLWARVFQVS